MIQISDIQQETASSDYKSNTKATPIAFENARRFQTEFPVNRIPKQSEKFHFFSNVVCNDIELSAG
jgi:hypothetical protein